jgi:hypothetical protein
MVEPPALGENSRHPLDDESKATRIFTEHGKTA